MCVKACQVCILRSRWWDDDLWVLSARPLIHPKEKSVVRGSMRKDQESWLVRSRKPENDLGLTHPRQQSDTGKSCPKSSNERTRGA